MSKVKKILAVILSMAMVLGMSMTTFAEGETTSTAGKISGVEPEVNENNESIIHVYAYQIVKYNEAGYYEEVLKGTITETDGNLAPSADDLKALMLRTDELTEVEVTDKEGTDYKFSSSVSTPGAWMILVKGSQKYLYNPAVISVEQDKDGLKYGHLNLASGWDGAYLKKSEPTIKKEVIGNDVNGVQYGDILQFQITADVPSYAYDSTTTKELEYIITDTLTGLELVVDNDHTPTATVRNEANEILTNAVTAAIQDGAASFEVKNLGSKFLIDNAGQKIVITYYAKVTTEAELAVDKTTNTASLKYSTNDGTQEKTSDTKHYTFGIDTGFNGVDQTTNKTGEFVKISEDGEVQYTETAGEVEVTKGVALAGAEFQLHIGSKTGEVFKGTTFTTDANGRLQINGLDSDVDYYLIETKAPTGYSLNDTPIKVRVNASYDTDGTLTGYSVTIGTDAGSATTHYGYSDTDGTLTMKNTQDNPSNPYGFKNTKLASLPSTGGIGTTIFTIGGVILMIGAAAMFFATRKRYTK